MASSSRTPPASAPPRAPRESEPRSGAAVKRWAAKHETEGHHAPAGGEDLFQRLRCDARRWSRNRNFELYQCPNARRTLRHFLWLRQLERDLELCMRSSGTVRLLARPGEAETEAFVLALELPALHLRRHVHLTPAELAALREGPAGTALLRESGETEPGVAVAEASGQEEV